MDRRNGDGSARMGMSTGDMLWEVGGCMPKALYRTRMEGQSRQGSVRNRETDKIEMDLFRIGMSAGDMLWEIGVSLKRPKFTPSCCAG